jgi:hypothetical protein
MGTMDRQDLREELLPSRNRGSGFRLSAQNARLVALLYNSPTTGNNSDSHLPGRLEEFLDLGNPLPPDRKYSEIMSGVVERRFVEEDDVRGNTFEEYGGRAAYCFFILVYTSTIGLLVWFNPEIRLGWLLLAPLPLYIPCVFQWWRQRQRNERLATTRTVDDESQIPVRLLG